MNNSNSGTMSPLKINLYNNIGHCTLVDCLGNDMTPVKAARQSYGKGLKDNGGFKDQRLLFSLLERRHTSPFEQASITWELKIPIFVMRQFVRHRTFRLNEFSRRYKDTDPEFYTPYQFRKPCNDDKQKSQAGEFNSNCIDIVEHINLKATTAYKALLDEGVAREQARMVLPVNTMTELTVNADLHNFIHFLKLRMDPHAQWEIQQLAAAMYITAEQRFPIIMNYVRGHILADVISDELIHEIIQQRDSMR